MTTLFIDKFFFLNHFLLTFEVLKFGQKMKKLVSGNTEKVNVNMSSGGIKFYVNRQFCTFLLQVKEEMAWKVAKMVISDVKKQQKKWGDTLRATVSYIFIFSYLSPYHFDINMMTSLDYISLIVNSVRIRSKTFIVDSMNWNFQFVRRKISSLRRWCKIMFEIIAN